MKNFYLLFLLTCLQLNPSSFSLATSKPCKTTNAELSILYERNCFEVNTLQSGFYQITASISGGVPPYQVQVNETEFIEVTMDNEPFNFEVMDGEGFRIFAQDSDATPNEAILEELELPPCRGLCQDLTLDLNLDCQPNGTGILTYEVIGANGDYTIEGNPNGDFLTLHESFFVEVTDQQGCKTFLGGRCPPPETYAVFPGEPISIDEIPEEDEPNIQIIGIISSPNSGEIVDINPNTGQIVYVANADASPCQTDQFEYITEDNMGNKDTILIEIEILPQPLVLEWEIVDCFSACDNFRVRLLGGCPPYQLSGYVNDVTESNFNWLLSHPFNETFTLSVEDNIGDTYHLEKFVACSNTSNIPPCNPSCENIEIQVEEVLFLCNGDGTNTLDLEGVTGGSGTYEYHFDEDWDVNAPSGTPYSITIVDENDCYTILEGETPDLCHLQADNITLHTLSNTLLGISIPQQSHWVEDHQIQLKEVETPANGSVEWAAQEMIVYYTSNTYFEGTETFNYTLIDQSTNVEAAGQITIVVVTPPCSKLELDYEIACTDPESNLSSISIYAIPNGEAPFEVSQNDGSFTLLDLEESPWSFPASNLYRLVIKDANDCFSDTLEINAPPAPDFTVSLQSPITNHIATLQIEPIHDFNMPFQVSINDENYQEAGNYVFDIDTLQIPEIVLQIKDSHECESNSYHYAFRDLIFTHLENENTSSPIPNIQLFPNPNKGNFTISIESKQTEEVDIEILDITGRVKTRHRLKNTATFERQNLPSGLYFIRLSGKNWTWTEKMIVE